MEIVDKNRLLKKSEKVKKIYLYSESEKKNRGKDIQIVKNNGEKYIDSGEKRIVEKKIQIDKNNR